MAVHLSDPVTAYFAGNRRFTLAQHGISGLEIG